MTETSASVLDSARRIHFIGIGGSGMCPLAEILHTLGYTITGSDNAESDNVVRLRKLSIPVHIGHDPQNLGDAELIVYTAAVPADNPELTEAARRGLPVLERAQLLGMISRRYSRTVAVAGTHGKTTTSSLLTQILLEAGRDPSAFIGGRLPAIDANGRAGRSPLFVCEACEFKDHYLQMRPAISVILDIDADHLDYFGSLDNIIRSFHRFAELTSEAVIYNRDDKNTCLAVEGLTHGQKLISCGRSEGCEWQACHIRFDEHACAVYEARHNGAHFAEIHLGVPGEHNVLNSLTAVAAAYLCGLSAEEITAGAAHFCGAGRRFERLGTFAGVTLIDDYAHHPTEIAATLHTARAMKPKCLWAVFQPFTFSRTAQHLAEFAEALSLADKAVVSDIMGSREVNTYGVHADQITEKISGGVYLPAFPEIADYVAENAEPGDVVVTMGGGNIYLCARQIRDRLKEK